MLVAVWDPWQWSSSAWSALTFVVLVVAALIAWRQVKEAQRVREEQSRPFVLIDFHAFTTIIEIRITNIGTTLARNVRFEFTPPLASARDDDINHKVADLNVFKHGIPSLAPRKEIKLFFDQFPSRLEKDLPLTYDVTVSYEDQRGKRYSEPTVLDISMYVGTGGISRYGLHEIHKELKTISESVRKWTDWSGLKVVTSGDIERRNAAFERELEERQAASAIDPGTNTEGGEDPNAAST